MFNPELLAQVQQLSVGDKLAMIQFLTAELLKETGLPPETLRYPELSQNESEKQSLSEKIGDLIGVIDSQAEPHHQFKKTDFGEQIASKLAKQGIRRP